MTVADKARVKAFAKSQRREPALSDGKFIAVCSRCALQANGVWRTAQGDAMECIDVVAAACTSTKQPPQKELKQLCSRMTRPLNEDQLREVSREFRSREPSIASTLSSMT